MVASIRSNAGNCGGDELVQKQRIDYSFLTEILQEYVNNMPVTNDVNVHLQYSFPSGSITTATARAMRVSLVKLRKQKCVRGSITA